MLASNALLIVTAFGLYYIGREGLRHWAGTLHVALGFGFPVVLAIHVFRGRRHHAEQVTPSTSITLGPPRRDGSAANPKAATSRWPSP